ncbi:endolytic transglycosylase MltG [bacterium]|nr:endolytic transglycosylase MltG [bacterium]
MKKIILTVFLIAVAVALFKCYSIYSGYQAFKTTKIEVPAGTTVVIEKGNTWNSAAKKLAEAKVITDAKQFMWMIKEKDFGKSLKTGEFEFSGEMDPEEAAKKIMSGKVKLYSFTIPEGYNKYDASAVFKNLEWMNGNNKFLEVCHDKNFLASIGAKSKTSCEGLLFPSTYSFPRGSDIIAVMKKMAAQMKETLKKYENDIEKSGMDVYEMLKLASIVEKETGAKAEQPKIASVFLNRKKIGMKMQTDPSVIYGLLPKFNGNLTKKDLLTDHPWNTYTRYGYPATPLCFPGEGAIKSVLHPDSTNYLYFVATGKGYHYFSKTLKEHNAAVDHYQVKGRRDKFVY